MTDFSETPEYSIEKIRNNNYEKVISDYTFTGSLKNWIDILREAKSNNINSLALMTSHSKKSDVENDIVGENLIFMKPLTKRMVNAIMKHLIDNY